MTLTDLLGNNDAEWMAVPGRPCACPIDEPGFIGEWADRWFPRTNRDPEYARQLCAGCPTKNECLKYGLDNPDIEGVLGGLTEHERNQLRKQAAA